MNYFVYGYVGKTKKRIGRYNSYWNAVQAKEKARKSGGFDKVIIEEPLGEKRKKIIQELGMSVREALYF